MRHFLKKNRIFLILVSILILYPNLFIRTFAQSQLSIEEFLVERKIDYQARLKKDILYIKNHADAKHIGISPLETHTTTLSNAQNALERLHVGCMVLSTDLLLDIDQATLETLFKTGYHSGADLILEGALNTTIEAALDNTSYIALQQYQPKPPLNFFQPASIATINRYGVQITIDPPMTLFAQLASQPGNKSLDIGGGYGVASLHALKLGASNIESWEVSPVVTEALQTAVDDSIFQGKLSAKTIDFKQFEPSVSDLGSFDVILMSRVLHLFTPNEIEQAAKKLFSLLKPGATLIISGETPLIKATENFIPVYLNNIALNKPWPGHISQEEMAIYLSPERAKKHSTGLTLFDLKTPAEVFTKAGFIIKINEYINREGRHDKGILLPPSSKYFSMKGNESIWLALEKPALNQTL